MDRKQIGIIAAVVVIVALVGGASYLQHLQSPASSQTQAPAPIAIHYSASGKISTYAGTITLAPCESLGTSITTQGSHLRIGLQTARKTACNDTAPTSLPFAASFSPAGSSTPTFDGLTINDQPVPISGN